MKKLLVIVGPTATGKTELAMELARKFKGEIVSADARQVYRRLDIGTGKELPAEAKFAVPAGRQEIRNLKLGVTSDCYVGYYSIEGVKIWLYDVIELNKRFSAVEYAELSAIVIRDIWRRNKLPIMVGGAGFYIKSVLEGVETAGVEPDWELREKLNNLTTKQLINRLNRLEPERWEKMNKSDRNNPRRLIRIIEVILQNQKPKRKNKKYKPKTKKYNVLMIGLTTKRECLYERIDERVEKRVEKGIIEEIEDLLNKGYSWDDVGFNTLGYKEWRAYFSGLTSKGEAIQRWKYDEHGYARRQLTWFRKDKEIRWYDITDDDYKRKVEERVKKWYYT